MTKFYYLFLFLIVNSFSSLAQYSIQSPLTGHEGIKYTDERIKNWASFVTFDRGPKDIQYPENGYPTIGDEQTPLGPPTVNVLSLGDGGQAILQFEYPITNGDGPDFAVFENGFTDLENDTMAFLELAFVEVSSNGIDYFRFPSVSLMQTDTQIDNSTFADARLYHNLAGKHIAGYGTPFDLDDLPEHPDLDKNAITHVKIIDVIGSIDPNYGSLDSYGNIINDPYPTNFPSGGFDLAAIAVLHENKSQTVNELEEEKIWFYPNPNSGTIYINNHIQGKIAKIIDLQGRIYWEGKIPKNNQWNLDFLRKGFYFLYIDGSVQKLHKIN
ncbi:MAG TPA: T9SS type A sorting domain-containing protein [Chitinophagaceae bacterium]|nr:T9SS type A sorting domain-containing protein [Chitinophagaceae bacterium]